MQSSILLKQCRDNLRNAIVLMDIKQNEEMKLYPKAINYKSDKIQTSIEKESPQERRETKLNMLDKEIDALLDKIQRQQITGIKAISKVGGVKQTILMLYYLSLITERSGNIKHIRQYTFKDIADIIGYTESHTKKLNYEALKDLDNKQRRKRRTNNNKKDNTK